MAYYVGGLLGGITGIVMGYDLLATTQSSDYQATERDPLYFNGRKITAKNDLGEEVASWNATSGRSGIIDQWRKGGPIPEGIYSVNPRQIQRWSDLPWYQKVAAIFGRGEWPGWPARWGYERVPIDIPGESIFGREGFFIHGGWGTQTSGCIKIVSSETSFFNYLFGQKGTVPLTIKYGF